MGLNLDKKRTRRVLDDQKARERMKQEPVEAVEDATAQRPSIEDHLAKDAAKLDQSKIQEWLDAINKVTSPGVYPPYAPTAPLYPDLPDRVGGYQGWYPRQDTHYQKFWFDEVSIPGLTISDPDTVTYTASATTLRQTTCIHCTDRSYQRFQRGCNCVCHTNHTKE